VSLKVLMHMNEISKKRELARVLASVNRHTAPAATALRSRYDLAAARATAPVLSTETNLSSSSDISTNSRIQSLLFPSCSMRQVSPEGTPSSNFLDPRLVPPSQPLLNQQDYDLNRRAAATIALQNLERQATPRATHLDEILERTAAAERSAAAERNAAVVTAETREAISGAMGAIVKEKVKAALESQHQRGKKRNNLNANERLELTRSRNREHAKSTRLRKKARYEELEKSEIKLTRLLESKDLQEERVRYMKQFLLARQHMLNKSVHEDASSNESATGGRPCDILLSQAIINPVKNFRFDSGDGQVGGSHEDDSPVAKMRGWDERILLKASAIFSKEDYDKTSSSMVTSFFEYEIEDGDEGIAISNNNSNGIGYAHIDLVRYKTIDSGPCDPTTTTCTKQRTVIAKGVLRARFEDGARLSSVAWTTIENHVDRSR